MTLPHNWFPQARKLKRKIFYHLGPTNSGKTYTIIGEPSNPGLLPLILTHIFKYLSIALAVCLTIPLSSLATNSAFADSPAVVGGVFVSDNNTISVIADAGLKAAINTKLNTDVAGSNRQPTQAITLADIQSLKGLLSAKNLNITDLSGLELAINLDRLDLSSNSITVLPENISNLCHLQTAYRLLSYAICNKNILCSC